MQIILANTHMNVQLNIQLSQGSAATNLRGGGKFTLVLRAVHIGIQQ